MKKTQLFLLHFAGGNCYSFQFLTKFLSSNFEIHSLELPGRGNRMADELITTIDGATEDYYKQLLEKRSNAPFIIYGHSMGAILGLYLTKRMEQNGDSPLKLIVSGSAGPTVGYTEKRYNLPQKDFKNVLRNLGGISEEVLNHDELFEFFSPVIRADFEVIEGEELSNTCISTDIHAIMGDEEKNASHIDKWKTHSTGSVNTDLLTGDHFFIKSHPEFIVNQFEHSHDNAVVR